MVDANVGNTQGVHVQGTQPSVDRCTSRRFANLTTEYPNKQLLLLTDQLFEDLGEKSLYTVAPG